MNQETNTAAIIRYRHDPQLDFDTPIYRFVPWRWLEDLLVDGNLTLVRPESWDDPYELIHHPIQVRVTDKHGTQAQKVLDGSDFQVFSQSWTTKSMADTMLRAYSRLTAKNPENDTEHLAFTPTHHATEAIQISTTIGKLQAALRVGLENTAPFEFLYMIKVAYMPEEDLAQRVVSTYAHGPDTGKDPDCVASLLSVKRDAYEAENEVRPIVLLNDAAKDLSLLKIKIKPQFLIDSISIDPRIGSHKIAGSHIHDYGQRYALLEKWGFASKVKKSHLYSVSPFFDALLDLDAPDCNLSEQSKARWRAFLAQHQ
ncbi:hypothetical protein [Paraburkholderia caribensis]|uniref:hypothetical protein n=1 Tax=Paraburkholderia caribensis TaxID=75105 RepID=UPI001CAD694B|nr:hypothetical protein [Paraburkholderia caribensis]CAG9243819.1 conserved hypothetical protein [Paraburkholderia caribensis]